MIDRRVFKKPRFLVIGNKAKQWVREFQAAWRIIQGYEAMHSRTKHSENDYSNNGDCPRRSVTSQGRG